MKEDIGRILQYLGEDIHRSGLEKTPERAAKTLEFLTQGYHQSLDDIKENATMLHDSEMLIIERQLPIYSLCEEHLLPIMGHCNIAYAPHGKKIKEEKLHDIINIYSRRLQNQENLTKQIAAAISQIAGTPNVAITISAKHLAKLMANEPNKDDHQMSSSVFTGELKGNQSIAELLA